MINLHVLNFLECHEKCRMSRKTASSHTPPRSWLQARSGEVGGAGERPLPSNVLAMATLMYLYLFKFGGKDRHCRPLKNCKFVKCAAEINFFRVFTFTNSQI